MGKATCALYPVLITTVPVLVVKVKGKGEANPTPKTKVMAPDVSAVIETGIPIKLGLLDCVTVPVRVTVVPSVEPISGK